MSLTVYRGAPVGPDLERRLERERRVYPFLDALGVEYDRIDHPVADNMEVCALIDEAFGRTLHPTDPQQPVVCKNLFLTNKQHTRFYLLMMPGAKRFLTRDLSAQINSSRLSFASPEEMLEMLDLTPGSVSVLGLMNDPSGRVRLLVDRDIVAQDYVACHPCMNTSSLRLRTADLTAKILPALRHAPTYVTL